MNRLGLRLDPLDTLFFRDGRPFDAASRASGGLPLPQTLAGAVRTYLLARAGFDLGRLAIERRVNPAEQIRDMLLRLKAPPEIVELRFRGPWLALVSGKGAIEPLLHVPATLVSDGETKKTWHRSDPLQVRLPGWRAIDDLRPLWRRGGPDAKRAEGFLTPAGVDAFLAGGVPGKDDLLAPGDLFDFDQRTGIEIDPGTLTAAEGRIYGISLLALRNRIKHSGSHRDKEVCLYAEVLEGPAKGLTFPDPLPLGGEGRHVQVRVLPRDRLVAWPQAQSNGDRSLWLLASPAFLPGPRALPSVPPPARLIAAASGTPLAVSGWDVARGGPRPARFAVPAGSVYFVEGPFTPPRDSLCADAEDVAQGWGFALRGSWNHA
jgi:CRISPR-associated protein Cmr3